MTFWLRTRVWFTERLTESSKVIAVFSHFCFSVQVTRVATYKELDTDFQKHAGLLTLVSVSWTIFISLDSDRFTKVHTNKGWYLFNNLVPAACFMCENQRNRQPGSQGHLCSCSRWTASHEIALESASALWPLIGQDFGARTTVSPQLGSGERCSPKNAKTFERWTA